MSLTKPKYTILPLPDRKIVCAVSANYPYSPFLGSTYVDAMIDLGKTPCAIVAEDGPAEAEACIAFMDGPAGLRNFLIPSTPKVRNPADFWSTVYAFCRDQGVSDIRIETYASKEPSLPPRAPRISFTSRYEYYLSLESDDLRARLSKNHARNLKKAQASPLRIRRSSDTDAVDAHCKLVFESLQRRRNSDAGVQVSVNRAMIQSLMDSGCAEIWQAMSHDTCQSSIVLLRSERAAYYYSAGTSAQGLRTGASVMLILAACEQLQRDGLHVFNLGGAGHESAGLRRFKRGFGAQEIGLERAHVRLLPRWLHLARRLRRRILRAF